jgi:hypothetical protein
MKIEDIHLERATNDELIFLLIGLLSSLHENYPSVKKIRDEMNRRISCSDALKIEKQQLEAILSAKEEMA